MAQDTWFYTREGNRLGPVSFEALQTNARDGALNPRLDMVWTQGMAEWKSSGEVEGLFEKRASSEAPESLAPPADPYKAPAQDSVSAAMSLEGDWPGARRRMFLIMTILFPVLWNLGFAFGAGILGQQLGPEIMAIVAIVAALVPLIVGVYFGLARLANVGMSRWWYLAHFVPFLNFWVGFRSVACPAGYAYHKKLDTIGWVLAILYWLLVILSLVVVALVIALLLGAVGDPGLKKQVGDMLRAASERSVKP